MTSFRLSDNYAVNINQSSFSVSIYVDLSTNASGYPTGWTVWAIALNSPNSGLTEGCSTTTTSNQAPDFGCYLNDLQSFGTGDTSVINPRLCCTSPLYGTGFIKFQSPFNGAIGTWTVTGAPVSVTDNETITTIDTAFSLGYACASPQCRATGLLLQRGSRFWSADGDSAVIRFEPGASEF